MYLRVIQIHVGQLESGQIKVSINEAFGCQNQKREEP